MFLVKAYLPVNESFGKLCSRIMFIAFGVSSSDNAYVVKCTSIPLLAYVFALSVKAKMCPW